MYNTITTLEKHEQNTINRDRELSKIKLLNSFRHNRPFSGKLMRLAYNLITASYHYIQNDLDDGRITWDDLCVVTDYINNIDPFILDPAWESMIY